MRKIVKYISFLVAVLSLIVILSACNSEFVEGDPFYYELIEIDPGRTNADSNHIYMIDPFEKKVIVFAPAVDNMEELPYELEEYTESEEELSISYEEDEGDHFEKKSDSLWKSLETETEYSVEKTDGEYDYTKVERP